MTSNNTYPESGSTNATITTPLGVGFNAPVLDGNNISGVTLKDSANTIIPVSVQTFNQSILIIPLVELRYSTNYTATIPSGAVQSYSGQSNNAFTMSFNTDKEFTRLGGQDRYDTSALIAAKGWEKSDYAIIAYGEDFPDALSASPLAKKYNAPILLTRNDKLPTTIDNQITRLGVKNVFIVGGLAVVSSSIQTNLESRGIKVTRIYGQDRYETAAAVANALDPSDQIFVVSGENFPDALSIASYAAKFQIPIFLSPFDKLPSSVIDYQKAHKVKTTYIIGGEGVISSSATKNLLGFTERIYGLDRYQTNFKVLAKFNFDNSTVLFANGELFPDALSGSALAALGQHPIILTSRYAGQDFIDDLKNNIDMMKLKYVIGGTAIMPDSFMDRIFK